ncbi:MAG: glucosamine-6-phosphate deaminase [Ignavibacteriales bacterium]|nr:glucosamine-6-phosphate deaminase [Ignavibacteriales bacterium]
MLVIVKDSYEELSREAAEIVSNRLRKKPNLVLGLATGSSPIGLYTELIRMHRDEGLDFSKVTSFNLDEYVGLPSTHDQSYHYFMRKHFFDHVNVQPRFIHIPNGMSKDVNAFCDWYEDQILTFGGIDLQVLGVGSNGHIAFNEPGSSLGSRTRIKTLTFKTRDANSRFFEKMEEVPKYAITMGVGTIMDAKEILLVANGKGKADAIKAAVEGPLTAMCPASIIQMHKSAILVVDKEAASKLEGEYVDSWKTVIFD